MTTKTENGFPTQQLTVMVEYWENVAHLFRRNPEPSAKELRADYVRNARVLRTALAKYDVVQQERDELQTLCTELQEQLAAMIGDAPAAR